MCNIWIYFGHYTDEIFAEKLFIMNFYFFIFITTPSVQTCKTCCQFYFVNKTSQKIQSLLRDIFIDDVENKIGLLKRWFDVNKLSIHLYKTKFMITGNLGEKKADQVTWVFEIKSFGVIMDPKLSWKLYTTSIKLSNKAKYMRIKPRCWSSAGKN